ncbi:MAG: tetratricopeptide repeat protein [Crocinitomicaceae bacterium]
MILKKRKSVQYFILCILFLSLSNNAQSQASDSLWNIWQDEGAADTARLKALRNYNYPTYLISQPDSGEYFARMQYEFAQKNNVPYYEYDALSFIGISFYLRSELDSATYYYEKSIEGFLDLDKKLEVARTSTNLGSVYSLQGNYAKTIEKYTQSLTMFEMLKDTLMQASCLTNIGMVYINLTDANNAEIYCEKAIKLFRHTTDKVSLATAMNNLGIVYFMRDEFLKAKEKYTEALEVREELNDEAGIAASINNIALVEYELGNYESAEKNYNTALELFKKVKDQNKIVVALTGLGQIYEKTGRRQKAIATFNTTLKEAKAYGFAEEIKNSAFFLYELHKKLRPRLSLEMHELYVEMKDSLKSEENQQEVIRQQFKYEYDKQAAADSISNIEKEKVLQAELQAEKIEKKAQQTRNVFLWIGIGVVSLFGLFLYNRFKVTQKQKEIIEAKSKEIMDSIVYAKRIQTAILPTSVDMEKMLPDSFVIYMPKDIVAGDFYWMEQNGSQPGQILAAVADCTGHGVPGAMVSVVCNNGLNRSVREHLINEPGKILDKTREIVVEEFGKSSDKVNDGMDIALISIKDRKLKYAGANNPLWIIRDEKIIEIKANKQPIGNFDAPVPYETHEIQLQESDYVYIFTDGFVDQFGGEKGKKYKPASLRKILLSVQGKSMQEQKEIITAEFNAWKGELEQVDDVCLLGIKIS